MSTSAHFDSMKAIYKDRYKNEWEFEFETYKLKFQRSSDMMKKRTQEHEARKKQRKVKCLAVSEAVQATRARFVKK